MVVYVGSTRYESYAEAAKSTTASAAMKRVASIGANTTTSGSGSTATRTASLESSYKTALADQRTLAGSYNTIASGGTVSTHTDPLTGMVKITHTDKAGNIQYAYQRYATAEDLNFAKGHISSASPTQLKTVQEVASPSFLKVFTSYFGAGNIGLTGPGGDPIPNWEEGRDIQHSAIPTLGMTPSIPTPQTSEGFWSKYGGIVLFVGIIGAVATGATILAR